MATVTGVVDWAGENKFGGHSIRVDGNYYNSKFPIKCEVGDEVEFDGGTTGKYCNRLKVVSKGAGGATNAASSKSTAMSRRGNFPIPKEDGQRSIIRQNALARAVEIVALYADGLDSRDDIAAEMVRLAMELERYTAGDLDAEMEAKAKSALTS